MSRAYLRYAPGSFGKPALWDSLVSPHLSWRAYSFRSRTCFGCSIEGNTSDLIQRYIYYFGVWEPALTSWVSRHLRSGDVFIDVGANIGYFTLLASRIVGESGKVFAIEASPSIFALLQRNLALNRAVNVQALNRAASDRVDSVVVFRGPEDNTGRTTLVRELAEEKGLPPESTVEAEPMSTMLNRTDLESARLIKIDVEGSELEVVGGLQSALGRCRADLELMIEWTPLPNANNERRLSELLSKMEEHGFHAYRIDNDYSMPPWNVGLNLARLRRTVTGQVDLLFSRRDEEVL